MAQLNNSIFTDITSAFTDIATAIRSKASVSEAFKPSQMASAIMDIPSGGGGSWISPFQYASSTISQYEGDEDLILDYGFYSCIWRLSTVSFPNCDFIGTNAFQNCYSLKTISFPQCTYIGPSAFYYCFSLTTASFPKCSYIGNYAFANCTLLQSLYLLSTSFVSLYNSNAFNYSPLAAGGSGKIYVPSSLYSEYLTRSNWSLISARLVSM